MKTLNPRKALWCFKGGLLATLFFFVFGIPSTTYAQDTTFSSVTVTTVDSANVGDTLVHWDVTFDVDTTGTGNNPTGGWIVQKITMTKKVYRCPKKEGKKPFFDKTIVYWEVWPVAPGEDSTTSELPNGSDDSYHVKLSDTYAPPNTYGTFKVVGELGYVNDPGGGLPATPGDPGGPDTNRTDAGGSTWAPGAVTEAGGLVATTTEPSFWAKMKASGKVSTRTWCVSWDKCKEDDKEIIDKEIIEEDRKEEDERGRTQESGSSTGLTNHMISFYPNPANSVITTFGADIIKTRIYSTSGALILESNERQIDIDNLAPGTYIIRLSDGEEVVSDILIVRH